MKYIMKVMFPNEIGNKRVKDPQFGNKVKEILTDVKAEAAYFGVIGGNRGCYVVVNIDDAAQMPAKAEPFFQWLQAEVDFIPVMVPEELGKATSAIEAATKKWG